MELETIRRRITELQNRQQVSYSNVSQEAKQIKNGLSIMKAKVGLIESNVVVKAPNIPEDLLQKLWERDQLEELIIFVIEEMNKKLDTAVYEADKVLLEAALAKKAEMEHKHSMNDITDYTAPEPYDDSAIKNILEIDNKGNACAININNTSTNTDTYLQFGSCYYPNTNMCEKSLFHRDKRNPSKKRFPQVF